MRYKLKEISDITNGKFVGVDQTCSNICYDSRLLYSVQNTLFIALKGERIDGHNYIDECYRRGVKSYIVSDKFFNFELYPDAGFIVVVDPLVALQKLAKSRRNDYKGDVVAIVGSNGKSIVKELIAQLYDGDEPFFRSPKSYNSQLGVALSLLKIKGDEKFAIIEAGISQPNEMVVLSEMISPNIVLFTNIGDAHSENFSDKFCKLKEKLLICNSVSCKKLIYKAKSEQADYIEDLFLKDRTVKDLELIGWSWSDFKITSPFDDQISKENIFHSLTLLKVLNSLPKDLNGRLQTLQRINMRMELREGLYGAYIINDSYNNDFGSFCAAISYMQSITSEGGKKVVFLSDFPHAGVGDGEYLYREVAKLLIEANIATLIAVGSELGKYSELFNSIDFHHYSSVDKLLIEIDPKDFTNSIILLKGARKFMFEKVLKVIELRHHNTILEVNLDNMLHNLNYYTSHIDKRVKRMAMVKASSYGCGTWEVALALERAHIDYLAVAFADEGIVLRKNGVKAKIVVLGSDPFSHRAMIEYSLEPEIHSIEVLERFIVECRSMAVNEYPIHIKIDSGMNRVGFKREDIDQLLTLLLHNSCVKVVSIFSHLAGSDTQELFDYTSQQIETFEEISRKIIATFAHHIDRHICNSSAITRFKDAHYDMVRLGIGLYGYGVDSKYLLPVASLKSVVVQISDRKEGESIGYGRNEYLKRDSKIATIAIGYADGLRRSLGCGNWSVDASGVASPIVGNICMDSTMIDVTDANIKVGEYVTIFGDKPTVKEMADKLSTIEYEILTDISFRVKRTYIKE